MKATKTAQPTPDAALEAERREAQKRVELADDGERARRAEPSDRARQRECPPSGPPSELEQLCGELERQAATIAELRDSVSLLLDHAGALNAERERRLRARLWRPVAARARRLKTPALGAWRHYPPRPLRIPRRYLRSRPPQPAPRISIVTPSYQQGDYLERTIRSVIAQGYPELEYIVQDGGSSDNSRQVLERHSHGLAYWASEPDGGQAEAINRGFEHATGEVMAYLNSDDLLLPRALNYVARYFQRHPDVDVIYGHRIIIDGQDGEVGRWILPRHADWATALADYVPQETLFWRRRAWERVASRVDDGLHFAIDWDLLLRFMRTGCRIVRVPRFLAAFRTHDDQKSVVQRAVGEDEIRRLREHWHGRHLSDQEIAESLAPFYRSHKLQHFGHRIGQAVTPTVDVTSVWQDGGHG